MYRGWVPEDGSKPSFLLTFFSEKWCEYIISSQIKKLEAFDMIADFIADKDALLIPFFEQMEKENEKTSQMIEEMLDEQDTLLLSILNG